MTRQAGLMQSGSLYKDSKYMLSPSEYELLQIYSDDLRLKDINLLKQLKKQGFFKRIPGTATIKDILANCEVIQ